MKEYIKSTEQLPKEFAPVWVRVCGHRPYKMYRVGNFFYYHKKEYHNMWCGIADSVLWRYCEESKQNK